MSVLLIACSAVLAGARSFTAIGQWAKSAPQAALARLGARAATVFSVRVAPSAATMRRVLNAVCPGGLADLLGTDPAGAGTLAVDGKSARGSRTVTGPAAHLLMELLSGRWYSAPGEVVVGDKLASAVGIHVGDNFAVVQQNKQLSLKVVGIDFDTHGTDYSAMTDAATFTAAGLTPHIDQFNVLLASNVNGTDWSTSAAAALTPLDASVQSNSDGGKNLVVLIMDALVAIFTLLLTAVAALGVLSMVVQDTRERVHGMGIFKALGMTPKQTIGMVLTSVTLTGLIAGLIGVPLGVAVEKATLSPMSHAIGRHLPSSVTHVYTAGLLLPLLAAGVVIALLGALLPAGWAARSRTATALRTE